MNTSRKLLAATLTVTAIALAGGATLVHAMGPCEGGAMQGMKGGSARMAERGQARLEQLKGKLKLTEAQKPAWDAFAAQTAKQMEDMRAAMQEHREHRDQAQTAPERARQHAEQMKQRLAAMEATGKALNDLYATLTPEQKAIMDNGMPGHRGR